MWAIFIALFGGLYWAFKIGSDRTASNIADTKIRNMRSVQDRWYEQVKDFQLESKLVVYPDTPGFLEKCDEAIAFIRTLPGLEKADFDFRSRKKSYFYVERIVLYIQMVKLGKLPSDCICELGNYLELSLDIRPSKAARIAFGKWVESSLKSFGVEHANLYYTGKDYASFEWEPFIYDLAGVISVNAPELETKMIGMSTKETNAHNAPIIKAKQQKERYEKWKAAVDGGEMQQFLELEFDEDHWLGVRQSTLEFLHTLPGLEYADFWYANSEFRSSCRNLIFMIEMVKRGKLPWFCYQGIPDNLLHNTLDLYIPRAAQITFVLWIENTLKEHGVPDVEIYYRNTFSPHFIFASMLLDFNGVTRITDPNLAAVMTGESEELIAARNKPLIQPRAIANNEQG